MLSLCDGDDGNRTFLCAHSVLRFRCQICVVPCGAKRMPRSFGSWNPLEQQIHNQEEPTPRVLQHPARTRPRLL